MLSIGVAVAFALIVVPAYILIGSIARIYVTKNKVRLLTDTLHLNSIYELRHQISALAPQNLYLAARCPDVLLADLAVIVVNGTVNGLYLVYDSLPCWLIRLAFGIMAFTQQVCGDTPWIRSPPCAQLERRCSLLMAQMLLTIRVAYLLMKLAPHTARYGVIALAQTRRGRAKLMASSMLLVGLYVILAT